MTDLRDDVREAFRERFGHKPLGIWSAPGRVNLIGEHTDYNEGFVLPLAIDRRTLVAAGPRDDGILRVGSTFAGDELYTEIEIAELDELRERGGLEGDWSQYPLGVAWAVGEPLAEGGGGADLQAVPGLDLMIDSNVPVGAGLSSSAAIECAVALALNELWRLGIPLADLARVGQRAENDFVGAPTGIMDQTASLLGKRDSVVFLDCRSLETEIVPLGLADAGLELRRHRHGRDARARDRRLRRAPRLLRARRAADGRRLAARPDGRRPRGGVAQAQRGDVPPDAARHHREPAGPGCRGRPAHGRPGRDRRAPRRLAPLDAGRLRDLDSRARPRRRDRPGQRSPRRPDDRRRIRRRGDRARPGGDVSRLQVAIDGGFAEHGFGQPETFTVAASDGAARDA